MGQLRQGLIILFLAAISGCTSVPHEYRDARDPWQGYNRVMFQFNQDLDNAFIRPLAQGYQAITPEPVNRGVSNFFANIADVNSAANNVLQFKLSRAGNDVARVIVNSTVGIGGLFDVATNMGMPSYKEDFGQTLGYWRVSEGPYIVLPLIGPSTMRDTLGLTGDMFLDPFFSAQRDEIYWSLFGLRIVDRRAGLLIATEIMEGAAIDRYSFVRDAYLQRRRHQIYDGNPPLDDHDAIFWDD